MILTIDIGNTTSAFGVFIGKRVINTFEIPTISLRKHNFPVKRIVKYRIKKCIITSVVPLKSLGLKNIISKELRLKPFIITPLLDVGMKVRYKPVASLGSDRFVNAVAVREIYGYPSIVVDFGTATTLDVLSEKGDFIGGVIMPGIKISRDALFKMTAKLPKVRVKIPHRFIGKTTEECIQIGITYGSIGAVDFLINSIKNSFRKKVLSIGTGGIINKIKSKINLDFTDKRLTLKGLRIIGEKLCI